MRRLVVLYFFLSGACGLIYEVVWTRYMGMVVGITVYALTTVLVAFMGGLALGGFLGGRYIDRSNRDPLKVYGFLEGVIGVYCLLIPFLIKGTEPLFRVLYQSLGAGSLVFMVIRFLICTVILLIPTTMMGATLPVLVKETFQNKKRFGWTTGKLYTINTIGAVAGSFFSGFVIIPNLGQWRTTVTAASINIFICAAVLLTAKAKPLVAGKANKALEEARESKPWSPVALAILIGYGVSGAAAMIYQVAWTRALSMDLGSSMYSFSLILTAFIAGLALGGAVMSPLADRMSRGMLIAGVLEILLGLSALAVVPVMGRLPLWLIFQYGKRHSSYEQIQWLQFGVAFMLVFVPTFAMGALLPLMSRLYAQYRGGVGRAIGQLYASNTVGSIVGSLVVGFVLIRWMGIRNTIMAATCLSVAVGVLFLVWSEVKTSAKAGVSAAAAGITCLAVMLLPSWDAKILSSGPYVYYIKDLKALGEKQQVNEKDLINIINHAEDLLFFKEGVTDTVTVSRSKMINNITLRVNGKTDASTELDMATQVLLGQIPMLLHPNPKTAMVLGLASGVSLGAVTLHPVERVDSLEISETIIQAYQYFKEHNYDPLSDPRVHLILADGRNHLALTNQTYDVVISEPSNPWIAGQGMIFTRETFETVKSKLNHGGIFVCWVGAYDMDLEIFKLHLRTFSTVFPNSLLFQSIPGDFLLVGFNDPISIDGDNFITKSQMPKVAADLARIGMDGQSVLAHFIMGPQAIAEAAGKGPLHTDDRRQMEFQMPKIRMTDDVGRAADRFKILIEHWELLTPYLHFSDPEKAADFIDGINKKSEAQHIYFRSLYLYNIPNMGINENIAMLEQAYSVCKELSIGADLAERLRGRASHFLSEKKVEEGLHDLERMMQVDPQDNYYRDVIGGLYLDQGNFDKAHKWLNESISYFPQDSRAMLLLGFMDLKEGKLDQAREILNKAMQAVPVFKEREMMTGREKMATHYTAWNVEAMIYYFQGRLSNMEGKLDQAIDQLSRAVSLSPGYSDGRIQLSIALAQKGRMGEAENELIEVIKRDEKNIDAHYNLGLVYMQIPGHDMEAAAHLRKVLELDPNYHQKEQVQKHLSQLEARAQ